MTIPLGFRPRSEQERLRVAEAILDAPGDLLLGFDDDGWVAACLTIAGRRLWWGGRGSPHACAEVLERLGLEAPRLDTPPPHVATLKPDLTWSTSADPVVPRRRPLPDVAVPPSEDRPLVTLLICTYNRADLLPEALASAARQTWPCEILVVDDGSTDGTEAVVRATPTARYVRLPENRGKPAALARGVEEARGEAILVLDDDDVLLPGAVAVLATALFASPDRVSAWADTIVFDHATRRPTQVVPACRLPAGYARRAVLQPVPAMPGATLVRRSAWLQAGPCDPSLIRGQDMDLFLALSGLGAMVTVPLPTFLYRSHDGLRGNAGNQWSRRDPETHRRRFLACVQPVFARRYAEASPIADRAEGHAWALGLWKRDLPGLARAELARWPGPYSLAEAWVRTTLGIKTTGRSAPGVLIVVDDGDEGALEATLDRHAHGDSLFVDLYVPRDPLGNVRLYWPGQYTARERLEPWLARAMPRELRGQPWRLALTSSPEWTPPPLVDPGLLPDTPAPEAVLALAAALGWPAPRRTRHGLARIDGPVSTLATQARSLLTAGRATAAMTPIGTLVEQHAGWRGGWRLAAEAFRMLGHGEEARTCAERAEGAIAL